ncbi:MAG: hypothetical protein ACE5G8_13040 [Anaerolineae bacterium]
MTLSDPSSTAPSAATAPPPPPTWLNFGDINVYNSTFSGAKDGPRIDNAAGTLTLQHRIVTNNANGDCNTGITGSNNLQEAVLKGQAGASLRSRRGVIMM